MLVLLILLAICLQLTPLAVAEHDFYVVFPMIWSDEETRRPLEYSDSSAPASSGTLKFSFDFPGKNVTLRVKRNFGLVTEEFSVENGGNAVSNHRSIALGSKDNNIKREQCLYTGSVDGEEDSNVAISSGLIVIKDYEYFIEPLHLSGGNSVYAGFPHALYRISWVREPEDKGSVYMRIKVHDMENDTAADGDTALMDKSWLSAPFLKKGLPSASTHPNVEILVVLDQSMVDYHGENEVTKYSLTLLNMVSKMFRDPSIGNTINIVVVKVLLADKVLTDSFVVIHDARSTLDSFCAWQKRQNPEGEEDPYHHDFAILLTRTDICATGNVPCSTVGMAMFGGMCSVGHSCSIVQDTGLNSAFTISQMIANSFGVTFDDGTTCGDDYIAYIMSSKRNNGKKSSKLAWSRCSRQQINHFLSKPRSRCLIDKPLTKDLDHMNGQLRLPGEIYDLDSQCQLNFGKQASFCRIMFGFVCRMLWCHTKQGKGGCTTTRSPSADGTHCGKDRWCIGGSCVPKVRSEPIDGNWGEWQAWSRCSRTCGGGIQRSSRECNNPKPAHGGSYCKGERQRIQICNKQNCQSTEDFRDVQCSSYDQSDYVGRKFKWKGFYNKARECALVCKAVGSWYYRIMAPKVEDGTPCRPASYDRCVNGMCMAVGCDYKLGSDAKEDECGVCLGNGSSCTVVENVYKKQRGIGYETIATIPAGATSIAIREETASRNYLAIFGHKNKNLLNGNYRIERPGIYNKGGTILQYKRRGQLEGVWIKGPLLETIRIAILFQANNTGIRYKYSKPLNNRVRLLEKALGIFLWRQAANGNDLLWTKCSATCGKGHRIAVFDCVDAIRDSIVDDLFCSLKEKPELVQECQERTCPLPDVPVEWKRSSWGACSKSCGSGYQRRSVYCVRTDTQSLVNFKLCKEKKPRTVQTCNVHDCYKGNWRSSTWSACSEDCGPGTRYRNVSCHGRNGKILDALFCRSRDKPLDKESCEGTCAQWVTGYWSQCSSCSGTKTRCVICINKKTFLPSSYCDPSMKPTSTKSCMEDGCRARAP